MNWDSYRRKDCTIDLHKIVVERYDGLNVEDALGYVTAIEDLQPIKSRQAAAIIIATCDALMGILDE